MKEAAGEANMTVITIVLIGVIAAIAIPLVTNMMRNTGFKSCCTDAGGVWRNGACAAPAGAANRFSSAAYATCTRTVNNS